MKKIVIHKPGGYQQLQLEEHPDLLAGPGEVLIETKAIGVNYADVCVRWGVYESAKKYVGWPITPGFEIAGLVKAVGLGVTRYQPGDRVFGITRFNGYASQVVLPEAQVFPVPKGFSFEEAAAFPAVFMTAYHAIHQLIRIPKGSTVLIHSAAGGVGTALLQLGKIENFNMIAVVGRSSKIETARAFGATHVIDKSTQDLWSEVERIAPQGVDVIFDANGPETLKAGYLHLAPTGKLVTYGAHTMLPKEGGRINYLKLVKEFIKLPRFNPLDLVTRNVSIIGFNVSFLFDRKELIVEGMGALLRWIEEGKVKAPTVTSFPMEKAGDAHSKIESGTSVGKLVLIP